MHNHSAEKNMIFLNILNPLTLPAKPIDFGAQTHRLWWPNTMRLDAHVFSRLEQTR